MIVGREFSWKVTEKKDVREKAVRPGSWGDRKTGSCTIWLGGMKIEGESTDRWRSSGKQGWREKKRVACEQVIKSHGGTWKLWGAYWE